MTLSKLAPLIGFVLGFAAFRFFSGKKRAVGIFLAAAITVGAFFAPGTADKKNAEKDTAEALRRAEQQNIVANWYAGYQPHIERMDRNWQQYHRILTDFDEDIISIETAFVRLSELAGECAAAEELLNKTDPPISLSDDNYDLASAIMKKTRAYAASQRRAVELTAIAADRERTSADAQEEQSRKLRDVMNTESPVGLFTASELARLRGNVSEAER